MRNPIKCLIIFSLLIFSNSLSGENIKPYAALLDTLIQKKSWLSAQSLAQRMLLFADDSVKKYIYFKQGIILMETDLAYEAYEKFRLVYENKYSSSVEKSKALIYTSLCYIQMEEYGTALHFLEAYPIDDTLKTSKNIIAGYCNYMMKDYDAAKSYFYYAGFDNYEILFKKDLKRLQTAKTLALVSSALVPGLGQVLLGEPLNGATALAVNVGFALLIARATTLSVLDATLFATPVFMRYYIGNLARTSQFADDRINRYKKESIKKLLKIN